MYLVARCRLTEQMVASLQRPALWGVGKEVAEPQNPHVRAFYGEVACTLDVESSLGRRYQAVKEVMDRSRTRPHRCCIILRASPQYPGKQKGRPIADPSGLQAEHLVGSSAHHPGLAVQIRRRPHHSLVAWEVPEFELPPRLSWASRLLNSPIRDMKFWL